MTWFALRASRYTGDSTQKTGVAIETRGFTFVTSGKKRDTLTGEATMRFYDHLQVCLAAAVSATPCFACMNRRLVHVILTEVTQNIK